jgi:UDP-N-acetylmuramoyl-tripeptide--D-alanyl-D-alanine ligase
MFAVGPLAQGAARAFGAKNARHFDDVAALIAALVLEPQQGVTMLVKGSRFMRMERVVAALTGQPAEGAH